MPWLYLFIWFALVTGGKSSNDCPSTFQEAHSSTCFHFGDTVTDWDGAKAICANMGARLAEPRDRTTSKLLQAKAHVYGGPDAPTDFAHGYWLGVTRYYGGFAYVSDRQPFSTSIGDWTPGQPDNWHGQENCLHLNSLRAFDYKWNDNACNVPQRYICEVKVCPSRTQIQHGHRSSGVIYNAEGSTCTFTCNSPGYWLIGHNQTICQHGLLWNYPQPECHAIVPAEMDTCRVSVSDNSRQSVNTTYTGATNCQNQKDAWMKFQPSELYVTIFANRNVEKAGSYELGVVGAEVSLLKKDPRGGETKIHTYSLHDHPFCKTTAISTHPADKHDCEGPIDVSSIHLNDGDGLCADMKAFSGGYFYLTTVGQVQLPPFSNYTKRVCFKHDSSAPIHCSQPPTHGRCRSEPLQLSTRLTRSPQIWVFVDGWLDPVPHEGNASHASQIEKYKLEVHGVDINRTPLSVQHDAKKNHTVDWTANVRARGGPYNLTLTLPEEGAARLYAVILEVHDTAGNVAYARRLVLYDNTSTVELSDTASMNVTSANPRSELRWQTDVARNVCVAWTKRFYNSDLRSDNFLQPVLPDTSLNIIGRYDQQLGMLSTAGTDNVDGVVKFEMSWSRNQSARSSLEEIPDVRAQSACLREPLRDGETYDVYIKATDIMGNSNEDSVRVSIDHTGPSVSITGLRGRFARDGLYIHNATDLSTMLLLVHANDPHSGLKTLEWRLGTRDLADDVGSGAIGIHRLNTTDCQGKGHCYCPAVGPCEIGEYIIQFSKLVSNNTHQGQHHREYYLTVTATNQASLHTRLRMDILVDESPPTKGAVMEGLGDDDKAEMDFTSNSSVHVHWHGFLDHESGVLMYRVALGPRCLTGQELEKSENATDVESGTSAVLHIPSEGHYYTSVVAYNGAMQPSDVACSDGITYDTTPPSLFNVTLAHARIGHHVACTQPDQQPWLVNTNLTRVRLANADNCLKLCSANSSASDVSHLPMSSNHTIEAEASDEFCRRLPIMTEDSAILLPSDYVRMTWAAFDEESDMEEYYIGIGLDKTSALAPEVQPFTPTHGHPSFHARHAGLSHGDSFYIFLKAVSKAGLSVQISVGPVVIDDTPPDVTQPLAAEVQASYLMASWNDSTFKDKEQPPGLPMDITFRVGCDNFFVTPFLSAPRSLMSKCPGNVTGCVRYPIRPLFAHDTEEGRSFFFQLHVTNAAGHVTTVNTSSVRLPAHYPPDHGVVFDVLRSIRTERDLVKESSTSMPDSTVMSSGKGFTVGAGFNSSTDSEVFSNGTFPVESTQPTTLETTEETSTYIPSSKTTEQPSRFSYEYSDDVDVILGRDEICIAWNGFYHEEEVVVETGVGTAQGSDDIVSFSAAQNKTPVCYNTTSFPLYTRLYSVIRATSSGGITVLSSDGFRMVPRNDSDNKLKVFNGRGCTDSDVIGSDIIDISTTSDFNLTTTVPLHAGDVVFVKFEPFVLNVNFPNSVVLQTSLEGYQVVVKSTPLTAAIPSTQVTNVTISTMNCLKDQSVLPPSGDRISMNWEITGPWTNIAKYFKAEIIDQTCIQSSPKKDKYKYLQCRLAETRLQPSERKTNFYGENIQPGHSYTSSLAVCLDDGCLDYESSRPVRYEGTPTSLHFQSAELQSQTTEYIGLSFEARIISPNAGDGDPCIFKWSVARDASGSTPVGDWRLDEAASCSDLEVKDQMRYSGSGHGSLYVCVQPVFPVRLEEPVCHKLTRPATLNEANPYHLIELSQTTLQETSLDGLLHSSQLGSKLHDLFDLDLDYARSDVMLSAILTNGERKGVTWFLTTNPRIPPGKNCADDPKFCITSAVSEDGKVVFPREKAKLREGEVYFICASVYDKIQPADVCGDGVVIDDSPPVRGYVTINAPGSGYLSDASQVLVTWEGFSDVEKEVDELPDDVTLSYSVALGSYPGGEDIVQFVQVGQRSTWTFQHLHIKSGSTCVATVRAKDRVGHVSEAWSKQVIIDNTPPSVGHVMVGAITQKNFVPSREVPAHWEGVEDLESGIDKTEVAIVSAEGQEEVVPFETYDGNSAVITHTSNLIDGHSYTALLKVTNKAGLSTSAASPAFTVDNSPPGPGRVWNSDRDGKVSGSYSTEVGIFRAHWSGFRDPHSGLDFYRIGLGTEPNQTDVHPLIYVGLQTSYVWRHDFAEGRKYYVTVEACNKAGLCRMASSNGVTFDNSPPTPGRVVVGHSGHHSKYLGHNSSLSVQWTGFSDPQTGIEEFTWCVGTAPGGCDVASAVHTLLSMTSLRSGITLPTATPLYVTVRARNPAGLETMGVSDSFIVDMTPPEVAVTPRFLSLDDGSPVSGQRDRSVLRLSWQFRDRESSVSRHIVTIRSQLTGRMVADSLSLYAETELMLPLEENSLLLDGDRYWAVVIACNAADLCTTANSSLLLIDSTPPVVGTFHSPLSWETKMAAGKMASFANVSWSRFLDAEMGIEKYYLSAGRNYNGDELTGGSVEVLHNENSGIQTWTLELTDTLTAGEIIHLSVFAENGLGLRSGVERMEFEVLPGGGHGTSGSLVAVRHSCQASYCTGECSCASEGRVCDSKTHSNGSTCNEMQVRALQGSSAALQSFELNLHIGSQSTPQQFTSSVKCLEGHWQLRDPSHLANVSRFEWSFGIQGEAAGSGIFNLQNDTVWNDVGHSLSTIHCLPGERVLQAGLPYVLYVRAWLTSTDHVNFTSLPVTVDHTTPKITKGGKVFESDGTCKRDVDYLTNETQVTACWAGVFQDSQSKVVEYDAWVGTSPGAKDYIPLTSMGTSTNWTFSTAGLAQGTRYYVTVRAKNGVGLMTTAVSDGVVVDVTPPVAGVVFASDGHTDRYAQSSSSTLQASWHGFQDAHSGVTSYHLALHDVTDNTTIVPFTSVGVKNRFTLGNLNLEHSHSYKVVVKARDKAGLDSQAVESRAILVDVTPPEGITCHNYQLLEEKTLASKESTSFGYSFYEASFDIERTDESELMKVELYATNLDSSAVAHIGVSPRKGGHPNVGNSRIEMKMPVTFTFSEGDKAEAEHEFLLTDGGNKTVSVELDAKAEATVQAKLYQCADSRISDTDSLTIRQVSEFAVSVCSRVRDGESGIRSLLVGIGTTPGGLQVRPLTPVGHRGHDLVTLNLQHGVPVYATAVVENHAGQWSRFVSQPIVMDRTPPEIKDLDVTVRYEGGIVNVSEDVRVSATWSTEDAESGVIVCTCRLEGQTSVEPQTQHTSQASAAQCQWNLLHPQHGASVRVTVTCMNGVQMRTAATSDPAVIILRPPDFSQATVSSLSNNFLQSPYYSSYAGVRSSNSSLEFQWHGVHDPTVTQLEFRFLHDSLPLTEWSPVDLYKSSTILDLAGNDIKDGNITAQIRGVNERHMASENVSVSVKIENLKPGLTGKAASATLRNDNLLLRWPGVFYLERDLTFAVFAGTGEGFGDVINHVTTRETFFNGTCTESLYSLYVTIKAVHANGRSVIYTAELKM